MMLVFLTDQAIDLGRIQAMVADVKQWRQQNLMVFAALFLLFTFW